jgi:hypothetical protein
VPLKRKTSESGMRLPSLRASKRREAGGTLLVMGVAKSLVD